MFFKRNKNDEVKIGHKKNDKVAKRINDILKSVLKMDTQTISGFQRSLIND